MKSVKYFKNGVFKTSLVFCFGTLSLFGADEALLEGGNKALAEASSTATLKQAFAGAKITGFGFGRYTGVSGNDGAGERFQFRFKTDVTTAPILGFSATAGILFSNGSAIPDSPTIGAINTNSDAGGSRAAFNVSATDNFNFSQMYASKEFISQPKDHLTSLKLMGGKMNLESIFALKSLDLGVGVRVVAKSKTMSLFASYYDTFASDVLYKNFLARGATPHNFGIGNDLFTAGIHYKNAGIQGKLEFMNIQKVVDYGVFLELAYKPIKFFEIFGQVVATGLNSAPRFYTGASNIASFTEMNKDLALRADTISNGNGVSSIAWQQAKNRGIYNLQARFYLDEQSYFLHGKIGFLGSFGEGYGTLMRATGGIDTAGMFYRTYTTFIEGFSLFGSGSKKGSDINIAYLSLKFNPYKPYKTIIGFDVLKIGGANNMPVMALGSKRRNNDVFLYNGATMKGRARVHNKFINADIWEISPSITYKPFNKFYVKLMYSSIFGNMNMNRVRLEIKYTL